MTKVVITSATRTAVGKYLGSLKTVPAQRLAAEVIKDAANRSGIEGSDVDEIIIGQVFSDTEASNIARVAGLLAGFPENVPAFTVNRQCASSVQAVVCAAQEIQTGMANIVVAGGCESMSRALYYLPVDSRYNPYRMGNLTVTDAFLRGSECSQPLEMYPGTNMGITAENVAEKYNITREEADLFALDSQNKANRAIAEGKFRDEILPIEVKEKKDTFIFDTDEHPRPNTTLEGLAKLRPSFLKDGMVTAGNASGMNDGASAVVVMSEEEALRRGIKPMVSIIDYAVSANDPRYMGVAPIDAIRKLLDKTGIKLTDIGRIELNEAFASQSLAVLNELGIGPGTSMYDRVNVNGGAIALGHALGNTGTRLITTLIYELKHSNLRYGLASMCIGGGQGMAILLENEETYDH